MRRPSTRLVALFAWIMLGATAAAQPATPVTDPVPPGFSAITWVAGVVFLLSIVKGTMDIVRAPKPGADPPDQFTTIARWLTLLTCIFGLVMVIATVGGQRSLLNLAPMALGATIAQCLVAIATLLRPGAKTALRIVTAVIALFALAIIPAYLPRMGGGG